MKMDLTKSAPVIQKIKIVTHEKLIEESKFDLSIENFQTYKKEIVSAKVKMLNIDAEW